MQESVRKTKVVLTKEMFVGGALRPAGSTVFVRQVQDGMELVGAKKQADEVPNDPPSENDPEDPAKPEVIKERDFTKMRVDELKAFLVERGLSEDEVKSLRKDELIAKVGEL